MESDWDDWADDDAVVAVMGRRMQFDEFWETGRETYRTILRPSLHSAIDREDTQLLEIGSGLGRICQAAAPDFSSVVGVDVSSSMVEKATELATQQAVNNVRFSHVDGTGFPQIDDESMDAVICIRVVFHLPTRELTKRYIAESARAMKPGGVCIFELPTYNGWWRVKGFPVAPRLLKPLIPVFLRNLLRPLATKRNYTKSTAETKTWTSGISFSRGQISEMYRSAGLEISSFSDSGIPSTRFVVAAKPNS